MTTKETHRSNIAEYKLGLKIVLARLAGADKLLNDILVNSQDGAELDKARRIKQGVQQCLMILAE